MWGSTGAEAGFLDCPTPQGFSPGTLGAAGRWGVQGLLEKYWPGRPLRSHCLRLMVNLERRHKNNLTWAAGS